MLFILIVQVEVWEEAFAFVLAQNDWCGLSYILYLFLWNKSSLYIAFDIFYFLAFVVILFYHSISILLFFKPVIQSPTAPRCPSNTFLWGLIFGVCESDESAAAHVVF